MTQPSSATGDDLGVRRRALPAPGRPGCRARCGSPAALELEYVQRMMAWMLLRPPTALTRGHAVQLGLGAGAITRFCHGVLHMRTHRGRAEPDRHRRLPPVVPPARRRRRGFDGARDGRRALRRRRRAPRQRPTCCASISTTTRPPARCSTAPPSTPTAARVLADGGVMTVNLFGRDASFERSARAHRRGVRRRRGSGACGRRNEGNTIVLALKPVTLPDRDDACRPRGKHRNPLRPAGAQMAAHDAAARRADHRHEPSTPSATTAAAAACDARPTPRPAAAPPRPHAAGSSWRAAAQLAARRRRASAPTTPSSTARRFAGGHSAQHPLVRLGSADLTRVGNGKLLDIEALTEWLAGALRAAVPAHRPAAGRRRPRRRGDVDHLRRAAPRAAAAASA